jgi:hypothetical protein
VVWRIKSPSNSIQAIFTLLKIILKRSRKNVGLHVILKGFVVCGIAKNKREDPSDLGDPTFTKQKQATYLFPHNHST